MNPNTEQYSSRLNQAFEYIEANIGNDLHLDSVAKQAYYSPYHFHRIFKFITGETLNQYTTRRRVEQAALSLIHSDESMVEIAMRLGFNEPSNFSRTFKKYYGLSPSGFRREHPHKFSKIRQLLRKNGQAYPSLEHYIRSIENLKNWITMNANIQIKQMPELLVGHVNCTGPQNLETAYGKIMQWASPLGLMNDTTRMLTQYHDSYKVTPAHQVRMSACIILNKQQQAAGEVRLKTIQGGKYIVGHFELGLHDFEKAWTGLFIWMNENGHKKADRDPFEIYYNHYMDHPEHKTIVDLCIPIA